MFVKSQPPCAGRLFRKRSRTTAARLTYRTAPQRQRARPTAAATVRGTVRLDPHWDLLAWNAGYAALLTDPARLHPKQRNLLWLVFRWPPARTLLADWEQDARALLGQFRSRAARRPNDPRFAELIGELRSDGDAARWYERRETAGFQPSVRRFRHPVVGELRLRYVKLAAVDEPGHHFLAYLPDDRDSEDALRRLQTGG
ncbi:hypothetical protein [Streptomyces sp. NPDC088760]|uniref:MmyB family transcriptional regulator n=1 Tax=Streptomyces sp. NPDC088760 TaxID=3365890 RepID=UPI00381B07CD